MYRLLALLLAVLSSFSCFHMNWDRSFAIEIGSAINLRKIHDTELEFYRAHERYGSGPEIVELEHRLENVITPLPGLTAIEYHVTAGLRTYLATAIPRETGRGAFYIDQTGTIHHCGTADLALSGSPRCESFSFQALNTQNDGQQAAADFIRDGKLNPAIPGARKRVAVMTQSAQ